MGKKSLLLLLIFNFILIGAEWKETKIFNCQLFYIRNTAFLAFYLRGIVYLFEF